MQGNKLVSILPQVGLLMEELYLPVLQSFKQAGFFVCITEVQKQVPYITSSHLGTSKYTLHACKVDEKEQKISDCKPGPVKPLGILFI